MFKDFKIPEHYFRDGELKKICLPVDVIAFMLYLISRVELSQEEIDNVKIIYLFCKKKIMEKKAFDNSVWNLYKLTPNTSFEEWRKLRDEELNG